MSLSPAAVHRSATMIWSVRHLEEWGASDRFLAHRDEAGQTADGSAQRRPDHPGPARQSGVQLCDGVPVSCFRFCSHLAGAREPMPRSYLMPLAEPLGETGREPNSSRGHLVRAACGLSRKETAARCARLPLADALIMRPAGAPAAKAGDTVHCLSAPKWRYRLTLANLFHNCSVFVP